MSENGVKFEDSVVCVKECTQALRIKEVHPSL